jgi:hypothetical protein
LTEIRPGSDRRDIVPSRWSMGSWELEVDTDSLVHNGLDGRVLTGASGRGWVLLPRALPVGDADPDGASTFRQAVDVVDEVRYPGTQITLAEARRVQSDIQLGETLLLEFAASRTQLNRIVARRATVLETYVGPTRIPIDLRDITVDFTDEKVIGHVVGGTAIAAIDRLLRPVEIEIAGFTLVIDHFLVHPDASVAHAAVRLPSSIADATSCQPAVIDLGDITVSPNSDYFIDAPDTPYGPWLLGDSGLVIQGTGFTLDLSTTTSAGPADPKAWRGLRLHSGTASGAQSIPEPCNTGYLRGDYSYEDAVVVATGFFGRLDLTASVAFTAINPFGQTFSFSSGWLDFARSAVTSGELTDGETVLPNEAAWDGDEPGKPISVALPSVSVQPDLDLTAIVDAGGTPIRWGELTRSGAETEVWLTYAQNGYLHLPAGACASYSPVATGTFVSPGLTSTPSSSLAALKANHVSGITFSGFEEALVSCPDRPTGAADPLKIRNLFGWLRIGVQGIDGQLGKWWSPQPEKLGDPTRTGYVGKKPFTVDLFGYDRQNLIAEFASSAAFDSHIAGSIELRAPCNVPKLGFKEMKLTSTACLVGGEVVLPTTGVPLEYWHVDLVPTGPPDKAGVLSVRTGRVLFTAAGINEPTHFARPFGLTWGEVLANGAVGNLYLDFNDWGQRFDGIVFHPRELMLSPYKPANQPYLGVFGAIVFPFFGVHHINIRDAAVPDLDPKNVGKFIRHVTVPKPAITAHATPTDLALSGIWRDVTSGPLAGIECADRNVNYNVATQFGFIGTGKADLSFFTSGPVDATVEIHSDATDIRFTSNRAEDFDISVIARLGKLSEIAGNLRIEGTTLRRMTFYGLFEESAAYGVLFGAKAGYALETNFTVTPSAVDFYASGDMLLMAGMVEVEASGTAHLLFDYATDTAEGELLGRVDCDQAVSGLSGEGQLTWFLGPTTRYLQGRVKVEMFAPVGGAGLEGGFFIGNDVPNHLAWVLDTADSRYKMSRALLPANITGIYGYGRASFAVNYYIFGGGVDIFTGAGAFSGPLLPGAQQAAYAGNPLLPYVVGTCGVGVNGEILGGFVSASGWTNLSMRGPLPTFYEGSFGLEGCVAWELCASVDITARLSDKGFQLF